MRATTHPGLTRRQSLQFIGGLPLLSALAACDNPQQISPARGEVFPAFSLADLEGRIHDSQRYRNTPLLINFWATWCPPCRREMADLQRLASNLSPKGLVLLAISVDEDLNLVREFLQREQLQLTVLMDAGQQWMRSALKIPGFPTTYAVGADGRVKDVLVGPRAWAESSVQQALAEQLQL